MSKQRAKKKRGNKWKEEPTAAEKAVEAKPATAKVGGAVAKAPSATSVPHGQQKKKKKSAPPPEPGSKRELEQLFNQIRSGQFDRRVKVKGKTDAVF